MKYTSSLLLFLILFASNAQTLSLNESGRYYAENVVVADGFSKTVLFENGMVWLKNSANISIRFFDSVVDSVNHTITSNLETGTYSQSGVFKKQTGTITYHFQLDVKEGKYRYAFSDFVFHYYATNRNLKIVDTGKTKPMEDKKAAGWQRLWNQHKHDIFVSIQNQIDNLSRAMVVKPLIVEAKEKLKVEW